MEILFCILGHYSLSVVLLSSAGVTSGLASTDTFAFGGVTLISSCGAFLASCASIINMESSRDRVSTFNNRCLITEVSYFSLVSSYRAPAAGPSS